MKQLNNWLLTGLILFLFEVHLSAQHENHHCGVSHVPQQNLTQPSLPENVLPFPEDKIAYFPVKHWIIGDDQGFHSAPIDQLDNYMSTLNATFADGKISFYTIGVEQYNNSYFSYLEYGGATYSGRDRELYNTIGNDNVINIFWVKTNGWSWAKFPNSSPNYPSNYIIMNVDHDDYIFAHELGHTMNMYHTFSNNELVDGSNCTTRGDLVCDTPADPNKSSSISNCTWIGRDTDANGDLYAPDVKNIMSYYGRCREHFTPGQLARARASLNFSDRSNLITGSPEVNYATNLSGVANVSGSLIALHWTNSNTAAPSTFEIEKTVELETEIIKIDYSSTYVDYAVSTAKKYTYRIRSLDQYGNETAWSNKVDVMYSNTSGCEGFAAWNSSTAYVGQDIVSYNNVQYRSKWWNQGANPETNSSPYDVWENIGPCTSSSLDPYAKISNLAANQIIFFSPSNPELQKVDVIVNSDETTIDSVLFVIEDVFESSGSNRRILAETAPFSIEFLPKLSMYTTIYTIAFSNGVAGNQKSLTVNFIEPELLEIVTTAANTDESTVWIHDLAVPVVINPTIKGELEVVGKVTYEITHFYENGTPNIETVTITQAPYTGFFNPKLADRIEVTAVVYDHFDRASEPYTIELFPQLYHPEIVINSPSDGSVIEYDFTNPIPIQVHATITNGEPIIFMPYVVYAQVNGNYSIIASGVDDTEAYSSFEFLPIEAEYIDIIVNAPSQFGPAIQDTSRIRLVNANNTDVLVLNSPNSSGILGDNKLYNFDIDVSGIVGTVSSITYSFSGPYNEQQTVTSSPFSLAWQLTQLGDFTVTASALTTEGKTIISNPIAVTVVPSIPTVHITSPSDNSSFNVNEEITFTAEATDLDGTIDRVTYFFNNAGNAPTTVTSSVAPFTITWSRETTGFQIVYAVAFDNDGNTGFSSNIVINLDEESSCNVVSWSTSTSYIAGKEVSLNGTLYEAKWWTLNENPTTNSGPWDVWLNKGSCSSSVKTATFNTSTLTVNPNPAKDHITLNTEGEANVVILDATGAKIGEYTVDTELHINVSNWYSGLYLIKSENSQGAKFIKE